MDESTGSRQPAPSGLSWSWPAFFATFAWLRAHRRKGLAWGYFAVSTPILLALLVVWQTAGSDACLRALEGQGVFPVLILCAVGAGWLMPPLLSARLVQDGSVPERRYWGDLAFQVLPLVIVVLWAPSYGNYITRAKVSEGIALAAGLKTPLAEYLSDRGRLPERVQDISATTKGKYVSEINLGRDGTIRAVFAGDVRGLAGNSVSYRPRIERNAVAEWTCASDDLPAQCLPSSCRK
jgi:type IV pilus assembly protein PilA